MVNVADIHHLALFICYSFIDGYFRTTFSINQMHSNSIGCCNWMRSVLNRFYSIWRTLLSHGIGLTTTTRTICCSWTFLMRITWQMIKCKWASYIIAISVFFFQMIWSMQISDHRNLQGYVGNCMSQKFYSFTSVPKNSCMFIDYNYFSNEKSADWPIFSMNNATNF